MAVPWLVLAACVLLPLAVEAWRAGRGNTTVWLCVYLTLATGFGIGLGDWQYATVFVVQFGLAVQGLFLFYAFNGTVLPREHRLLTGGLALGTVLRAILIVAGAAVLAWAPWLAYAIGALLIFWAIREFRHEAGVVTVSPDGWLSRHLPWWARVQRHPLSEASDLTGAVGSTLAALALTITTPLTTVPLTAAPLTAAFTAAPLIAAPLIAAAFTAVAATAFALLVAYQLPGSFIRGLPHRLPGMDLALSCALAVAGVCALLRALHSSGVSWAPVPPAWLPLAAILLLSPLSLVRRSRSSVGAAAPTEDLHDYDDADIDWMDETPPAAKPKVTLPQVRVSVRFPQRLVKGHAATFLVQIYPPTRWRTAQRHGDGLFGATETTQADGKTHIPQDEVEVELSCPAIRFAPPVRLRIPTEGTETAFWGQPTDSAKPGEHTGLLIVRDPQTGAQHHSLPFKVLVVDYAFGRVSRLAVNRVAAGVLALLSVSGFGYGLITQTNQVVGLVAGGVSGALSAFLTARMATLYRRPTVTTGSPDNPP